jgi:hypothetical protein
MTGRCGYVTICASSFRNSRQWRYYFGAPSSMTHYLSAAIGYVLVAAATAATVAAAAVSAPLSVSATVVRACKVDSAGSAGSINLACSKDVTRVKVSGGTAPEVLLLSGDSTSVHSDARRAARTDGTVRFITVNF